MFLDCVFYRVFAEYVQQLYNLPWDVSIFNKATNMDIEKSLQLTSHSWLLLIILMIMKMQNIILTFAWIFQGIRYCWP